MFTFNISIIFYYKF